MMIGTYRRFSNRASKKDLELMKLEIIDELCDAVRKIANEYPEEFFIVKEVPYQMDIAFIGNRVKGFPSKTIGAKLDFPTISHEKTEEMRR